MEASLLIVFAVAVAVMLGLQEWSVRRLKKRLHTLEHLLDAALGNIITLNIKAGLLDEEGNPLPRDASRDGNTTRH